MFCRKIRRALFSARPPDMAHDAGKISENLLPIDLAPGFALERRRNAGLRREALRFQVGPAQRHRRFRQSKKLKEFRQAFTDKTLHAHLPSRKKCFPSLGFPDSNAYT
jgi:hypothetical protein